jgi:hypothetical protein
LRTHKRMSPWLLVVFPVLGGGGVTLHVVSWRTFQDELLMTVRGLRIFSRIERQTAWSVFG